MITREGRSLRPGVRRCLAARHDPNPHLRLSASSAAKPYLRHLRL